MAEKTPVYLFSSGELKLKNYTIYFENDDNKQQFIADNISEIYIFGEVNLDKKFIEFISQSGITLHFFNYYGYYAGSFYPKEHINYANIMVKQVEHYLNHEKRMEIAIAFIDGAVKNMLQVIKYYKNRGKELDEIEESIKALQEIIYSCTSINELMAIEGNIRSIYYEAFDIILGNPDFVFEQRSRRPPKNYLNTLISFGNSLMYTSILSQIYHTHLDPRIGYLHSTNFRRYTLNLDVSEVFKPIIVDRIIFTVINKNIITKNDFEESSEGIMLKEKGREVFVQKFEDKLNSTIYRKDVGKNISYKSLIRMELYNLETHFINGEEYSAFVSKW